MFSFIPLPTLTLYDKKDVIAFLASEEKCSVCQKYSLRNTWASAEVQAPRKIHTRVTLMKRKLGHQKALLPQTWTPKTLMLRCGKSRSLHPFPVTEEFKILYTNHKMCVYTCMCMCVCVFLRSQRTHFPIFVLCQEFLNNYGTSDWHL